jgi:hypothetical protein
MGKENKQLINCPVCSKQLVIREFYCGHCETEIRGSFVPNELNLLSGDQLEFVRVFLLAQGNIKEVEKKMGISYPTVKNKLAEIIEIINDNTKRHDDVLNILEEIENGLVDVDEAIVKINQRRTKK